LDRSIFIYPVTDEPGDTVIVDEVGQQTIEQSRYTSDLQAATVCEPERPAEISEVELEQSAYVQEVEQSSEAHESVQLSEEPVVAELTIGESSTMATLAAGEDTHTVVEAPVEPDIEADVSALVEAPSSQQIFEFSETNDAQNQQFGLLLLLVLY
jgi:hypothetical protein